MRRSFDKFLVWLRNLSNRSARKKRLRACMIYYQYFGSLLYREAISLKEKGFEIDIICLRNSKEEKIILNFNGLNLYQIQSRPFAEKNPVLYFLRLGLFFLKSLGLLTLLEVFKRYDLVHVTAPPDVMVFTALVPKIFGNKIILDIHDIGPELYMRKLNVQEDRLIINIIKFLEKISCLFANHVITVTDLWRDKLVARSVGSSRCTVLLNVPDEKIFQPLNSMKDREISTSFNLYYHGSLEEHFGVDTLLKAMPIIKKHIPSVTLHIYGGKKGRLFKEFISFIEKNNMGDYVRFYNYVPFYKLPEILGNADIGIVPTKGSIFSDEALSMKSLEYIFLGIPIVISGTKVHRYYYDISMVKFFNPEDVFDLAMSVVALYKDSGEREKLVRNSKTFARKHGWKHTKKIYFQIVDKLVKKESDYSR